MMDSLFLSLEEDQPLAIFWANETGCDVYPLDKFLKDSKVDMSKEQAARYATELQIFIDDLMKSFDS